MGDHRGRRGPARSSAARLIIAQSGQPARLVGQSPFDPGANNPQVMLVPPPLDRAEVQIRDRCARNLKRSCAETEPIPASRPPGRGEVGERSVARRRRERPANRRGEILPAVRRWATGSAIGLAPLPRTTVSRSRRISRSASAYSWLPAVTGGDEPAGGGLDWSVAYVYTVRAGKIARVEMHADRAEALKAAGLQE